MNVVIENGKEFLPEGQEG